MLVLSLQNFCEFFCRSALRPCFCELLSNQEPGHVDCHSDFGAINLELDLGRLRVLTTEQVVITEFPQEFRRTSLINFAEELLGVLVPVRVDLAVSRLVDLLLFLGEVVPG